jgi:hypothetical protein
MDRNQKTTCDDPASHVTFDMLQGPFAVVQTQAMLEVWSS